MIIKRIRFDSFSEQNYPFNIQALTHVKELDLSSNIVIFVGDNGSGKSTLLQAIAYYNDSINVSKNSFESDYYQSIKELSAKLNISYRYKTKKGFFFSSEEFITYINNQRQSKKDHINDYNEIFEEFKDKSEYVRGLALGPSASAINQIESRYGGELQSKSHGEGFLTFFKERIHQKGIYILDEPESPLSAINQYQLLVMITDIVKNGSQVIIATHSPILMGIKDALIYQFSDEGINKIEYDDIDSVKFLNQFINNRHNFTENL